MLEQRNLKPSNHNMRMANSHTLSSVVITAGVECFLFYPDLQQGSAWLCVPLSTGGRKRGLRRNCHHHSLKTYSRALPGSASLCPVVVASEACTVIAITIV
ncbi:uncharacterized protein ISCGN_030910 [Ixodes scapularis]